MMGASRIHLVKEGYREDYSVDGVFAARKCCSAVVLFDSGDGVTVVDAGGPGYGREIRESVEKLGFDCKEVDFLVNTHSHIDHTYNNYLFSNAVIVTASSIWHTKEGNRVEFLADVEGFNLPGCALIETPGHMISHVSVLVDDGSGKTVVAGDAVRENIILSGRLPANYPDPQAYVESMKKVFESGDRVIPGHGRVIEGKIFEDLRERVIDFPVTVCGR